MTKIDLNKPVKYLDGTEPTPPETLGQAVAGHVLARSNKGPAMKFMAWARTLYENKPLELDKTDFEVFQKAVEDSEILLNFVKAPILEILIDAKRKEPSE